MRLRIVMLLATLSACGDDVFEADTELATHGESSTSIVADSTGAQDSTTHPAPPCADSAEVGAWEALPPLPASLSSLLLLPGPTGPLALGGAAACKGSLAGGVFELGDDGWAEGVPMPDPVSRPRGVRLTDGTIVVVDGAVGSGAVSRRDPGGAWDSPGTLPSADGAAVIGAATDDSLVVGISSLGGSRWFRSVDRGETWMELEGGPLITLSELSPTTLLQLPDGGLLASGLGAWSIFDGGTQTWSPLDLEDSNGRPASSAAMLDEERAMFVMGEFCCWGPVGGIPVAPSVAVVEVEALRDPNGPSTERSAYPCPSRVASEGASWGARLHGAGSGRVFVSLFDGAFEVFNEGVGRLPETPVAVHDGNVLAMPDGTLLVAESCGETVWRWRSE